MATPSSFNDYGPITWFRRVPVYLTTILIALLTLGMFATVFLATARADVSLFAFAPPDFWRRGWLWQLFTYPLINPPSFFFLFGLFFFYWFGTDVERYLGRSRYLKLFLLLLATPPLVSTLWWWSGISAGCYGSINLTIGYFVAFATLYPNLEYWGWITMKWLAFAGIVLSSMNYLPGHDWPGLTDLLATCGASFGYIRFLQGGGSVEMPEGIKRIFRRRPKFRVVPREEMDDDPLDSIDPLLDKISKHGISSLTARERRQLERARENLLKKPD